MRRQSTWTLQHFISGIVWQRPLHSSRQLPCPCFAIGLCLSRWCIWCWRARVWQGMRSCALQQVGLTLPWTLTGKLPRSWMKTFTVSEWSCRMDSCWLHSDESIDQTFRSKLGRAGAVHSCGPGHRWTIRKITIHRWDSSLVPKRKLSPTSVETTGATSDRFCGVLTGCKVLRESLDESQDGIHWPRLELCHRIGVYNYNDL